MKKLLIGSLSCIALVLLMVPMAQAKTSDGLTPANEGVCDVLQADGTTKGLYGLCVAFCEAQDHVDISPPITEADLQALSERAPSGRILANYNKKKQEGDPEMPCIKVEEPCHCWDTAELEDAISATHDVRDCVIRDDAPVLTGSQYAGFNEADSGSTISILDSFFGTQLTDNSANGARCVFYTQRDGGTVVVDRVLSDISVEQAQSCDTQIRDRLLAIGIAGTCLD